MYICVYIDIEYIYIYILYIYSIDIYIYTVYYSMLFSHENDDQPLLWPTFLGGAQLSGDKIWQTGRLGSSKKNVIRITNNINNHEI